MATTNRGKVAELAPAFAALGWEAVGLQAFPGLRAPAEDGASFAANARLKALHYAAATGVPALADDSGLAVEALGGAPGVHSARYAGPAADDAANCARLLRELSGARDRRARFHCALCLVEDGRVTLEVEGRCGGTIADAPRGAGGFGYDPLFVPDDAAAGGRTFAELPAEAKRAISHRGRALAALRAALAARGAGARAP